MAVAIFCFESAATIFNAPLDFIATAFLSRRIIRRAALSGTDT
jgi:hypothetical protein